jgi:hypothetical protein
MNARKALNILAIIIAAFIAVWLILPTQDVVAPTWNVVVTDTSNQPIAGVSVTAFAQQYTLESKDVEETKITGTDGGVQFSPRIIKANGLQRLIGTVGQIATFGAHSSFGTHTHIHADKAGYGDPAYLQLFAANEREERSTGAERQSSHIVLLKCPDRYSGMGCSFPQDPSLPIKPLNTAERP